MYDPLVEQRIPHDQQLPDSFWALAKHTNKHRSVQQFPSLQQNIDTEVAIVGGGYTGLSAALHLSKTYNVKCTVIEANQPGWACSGRNGGFVLPGTGRLSVAQMISKWGKNTTQAIYADYLNSVDNVAKIAAKINKKYNINCEVAKGGYLKIAHKEELVAGLHAQANLLCEEFGDAAIPVSQQQIESEYIAGTKSFGGVYYPKAFGINPWLLCQGLANLARDAGASIYGNTALLSHYRQNKVHHIQTNTGTIRAKHLIWASNAYLPKNQSLLLKNRMFPVLSSVLVTPVLTNQQLESIAMRSNLMVMDTRPLKYYYRLLPDKRLLFGGRGKVSGKNANAPKQQKALLAGLLSTFPQLAPITVDYFWSGWVSISFDNYPRIYHHKQEGTLYSGGYCGAGLAFSIQAGERLAQMLCAPESLPKLPYFASPLKRFPLPFLRRSALRGMYLFEALKQNI